MERLEITRRDILKAVGAAGTVGAFGAGTATAHSPDRHVVGMEPGRAGEARRQADQVDKTLDFGSIGQAVVGRWSERARENLERNPNVRYVEEDLTDTAIDDNDQVLPWGVSHVDAEAAHGLGHTGDGIHVAILDTGIRSDHPDLAANLGEGHAIYECDPDAGLGPCLADWGDDDGHGTHVAGTAGAVDNDIHVIGVAPEVTLHSVKVLDEDGSGRTSRVAEGIKLAADEGYDVINLSLGGDESSTRSDAIQYADERGAVLVAAAGNDGGKDRCDDDDCVGYPAADPETIGVSNTTPDDELNSTSSTGPEVDLAAPGTGILSTTHDGSTGHESGTSMSTPHVSGAAALLLANGTAPADVRDVLQDAAVDVGLPDFEQGAGVLNVANAIAFPELEAEIVHDPEVPVPDEEVEFEASLSVPDAAIVEYDWELAPVAIPPGGFPDAQRFTFSFTSGGEYTVLLTVTDVLDRETVVEDTIRVARPPEAAFEVVPDVPNEGEDVTFDASASEAPDGEIVGYEWEFGDGTTETTAEPVIEHTYGPAEAGNFGAFDVTLTVTDDNDVSSDPVTETVRVNAFPIAAFDVLVDPPHDPAVSGDPVEFDASESYDPDGEIVEYEWEFGDGTVETTAEPEIEHTYDEGGELTVTLRVTDDDGASDDDVSVHREEVTVHIRAEIDIKPNGNGRSPINLREETVVPAAVLHTAGFDSAAELDPDSVRFGAPATVDDGGGAVPEHDGGHVEDVDGSGDDDWHCHFRTGNTGFARGDDAGKLVGETHDGVPVFGYDDVRIVGRS